MLFIAISLTFDFIPLYF